MKIFTVVLLILFMAFPVSGAELIPPEVAGEARQFMPSSTENFAAGIMEVLREGIKLARPDLKEAGSICVGILAAVILVSMIQNISKERKQLFELISAALISCLLLDSTGAMIHLGVQAAYEISDYGKLFLPVLTTALAAQGGVTSSAAICSATMIFNALLTNLISRLLNPMVYVFFALSISAAALEEEMLKKLRDVVKWAMTWCLKIILYTFTGFLGITGVVSGSADAAALKVTKMTISGMVPVVGGILSDASEAVLVGAGTVKNAIGVYGMFAVLAIILRPFVKIGTHYLLLKGTAALCHVFAGKKTGELIGDFSSGLGFLLAMTGAGCMILIISITCFMKGVG